jgi:hypothetical protein
MAVDLPAIKNSVPASGIRVSAVRRLVLLLAAGLVYRANPLFSIESTFR